MNQPLNNSQAAFAQQSTQHAPNLTNKVNGVAQPMDPMGGSVNVFDVIDHKNGNHYTQQAPANSQGMPEGTYPMQLPNSPQSMAPQATDEGASPMDKWYKKPDNTVIANGQPVDPNVVAATPAPIVPTEFKNLFESSKYEDFQALTNKRDFIGELVNDDLLAAFKEGDFSGLSAVINGAVQQGVALSGYMGAQVSNKAVTGMFNNFQTASLPELLRTNQLDTMWKDPQFSDFSSPAMQPMVAMATNHVKSMFPNASPQEIQSKAMEMMQDYSKELAGKSFAPQQTPQQQVPQGNTLSPMEQLFSLPE